LRAITEFEEEMKMYRDLAVRAQEKHSGVGKEAVSITIEP
jgi:hypothetical protein